MPPNFNSAPRNLPWRLRGVVDPVQVTTGDPPDDLTLQWPTPDPTEVVSMEVSLSLSECIALSSAVDVGRDIAYNTQSEELWLLWCRIWKEACNNAFNFEAQGSAAATGAAISDYEDFIERLSDIMPKFRTADGKVYEPVIDLIECGCGDGSGSGNDSGALGVPGGTVADAYSGDIPSLCDLITGGFAQYLSNRVDDMLGTIANQTFVAEQLASIIPLPFVDGYIDQVRENQLAIEQQLTDPTWLESMNIAFVKAFNDPVTPDLVRNDLYKLVRFLPPISEGAPMLPALSLWSGVANMQEINGALRYYVGDGDPTICKPIFIASETGREPYFPTGSASGSGDVGLDICGFYDFTGGPGDWRVIPNGTPGSSGDYSNTVYSPEQSGWARGFVPDDSDLGIQAFSTGGGIVNITEVTVTGFETNPFGAGGPGVGLYKNGALAWSAGGQWPAYGDTPQSVTYPTGGVDADEIRVVNGSLRGDDILVIQTVDVVCS